MSSDYEFSDNDEDFYDDEMMGDEDSAPSDADMEFEADNEDFKVTTKPKAKSYQVPHDSFSKEAVQKLMNEDEDHISGIFGVDRDTASLLLRHMQWNKERLIEKYMDNASAVTVAAGISSPEPEPEPARGSARRSLRSVGKQPKLSSSKSSTHHSSPHSQFTCPICLDDSPDLQTSVLSCDHKFCTNCWAAYVASKVLDEQEHVVNCMAEGCALVSPDKFIASVLASAEDHSTLNRFQELVIRHYVACNNNLKFCPYPSCTNTVSCPTANTKSSLTSVVPIVSCGARGTPVESNSRSKEEKEELERVKGKEHIFCFGCPIDSDHRPCVCAVAKMWLKKCADDSETANWIKSNTKECTACNSTIEKNGGCNHMTCKKCKHEFCWVCMGPWSEHGNAWYSCNRYEEKAGVDARDAQSRSRASLERYLHYYNRWANHEQSAKLSVDLYAKTEKKMEEMQVTSALTWIEVQFMKKAVDEVEKCRTTLKWTYAMAYYLAKSNNKDLFEDNQRDLEKAVEDLSELLEQPIEPESIPSLRQKVTDKTVYVQKRNDIVLEDTANGFLENRWKWNVAVEGFDDPIPIDL